MWIRRNQLVPRLDHVKHAIVSFIVCAIMLIPALEMRFLVVPAVIVAALAGILKELYDERIDWSDLAADAVGIAAAVGLFCIVVA